MLEYNEKGAGRGCGSVSSGGAERRKESSNGLQCGIKERQLTSIIFSGPGTFFVISFFLDFV